jgi:ribonuclease D
MLEIAAAAPRTLNQLRAVDGISERQIRRDGEKLLQAIRDSQRAPVPRRQRQPRHDDDVMQRYDRLQKWRKQRAEARGVASDVILARQTMWELAQHNPQTTAELSQIPSLGAWRCATYGSDLLKTLQMDG